MRWFPRLNTVTSEIARRPEGDANCNTHTRPCTVEPLEGRQLLAASCVPETTSDAPATTTDTSSSLQLLAANQTRHEDKQAAPTKLRAKALSTSRIRITWNDTKGEKKFQLYRREHGS